MHPFKAFLSMYTDVSEEDWKAIESCLEHKIIQQNRIMLKPKAVCEKLYFLENGAIRFYTQENGHPQSIHFVNPPSLFTSGQSFARGIPSEFGIQAVEESYVYQLSKKDAFDLRETVTWNSFLKAYFAQPSSQ